MYSNNDFSISCSKGSDEGDDQFLYINYTSHLNQAAGLDSGKKVYSYMELDDCYNGIFLINTKDGCQLVCSKNSTCLGYQYDYKED